MLGVLLRVSRADGAAEPGRVGLEVDSTGFAGAFGADWAHRLRLVQVPACALSTPAKPGCRDAVPVPTRTGADGGLAADVSVGPDAGTLFAVTAGASGGTGDFSATSLTASASWQVSPQTGDFSWSYPLRTAPAVNGPTPGLAVRYSSGSVDGRTSSTNNQPSWVGEGFELGSGFVERKYISCAEDMTGGNNSVKTGDLCWRSDNATVSFAGGGGELVKDTATG
ncbi:MAG: hypothetical protein L0Y54_06805, partial [Sporichthyaceae bacterium]|nr:hypothetical protein [Sporichthyaceae bacterium]